MTDITKCTSRTCKEVDRCYRHKARPSLMQSYGDFTNERNGDGKCVYFWPLRSSEQTIGLDRALED